MFFLDCLSSQSQTDIDNNIFKPAATLWPTSQDDETTNIGLCPIDKSNERVGILMVQQYGTWGSVGVPYFPIYKSYNMLKLNFVEYH